MGSRTLLGLSRACSALWGLVAPIVFVLTMPGLRVTLRSRTPAAGILILALGCLMTEAFGFVIFFLGSESSGAVFFSAAGLV